MSSQMHHLAAHSLTHPEGQAVAGTLAGIGAVTQAPVVGGAVAGLVNGALGAVAGTGATGAGIAGIIGLPVALGAAAPLIGVAGLAVAAHAIYRMSKSK
jgi:hypothetical protein